MRSFIILLATIAMAFGATSAPAAGLARHDCPCAMPGMTMGHGQSGDRNQPGKMSGCALVCAVSSAYVEAPTRVELSIPLAYQRAIFPVRVADEPVSLATPRLERPPRRLA